MKTKNVILLGGIGFAIYYLTKKKPSTITANSTPDDADKDLTDVSNGNEPQSLSADDKLKLFNKANLSYTGGARPSSQLIADISAKREQAVLRLKELGLYTEFLAWKKLKDIEEKINKLPPRKIFTRPNDKKILKRKKPLPPVQATPFPNRYPPQFYVGTPLGLANEPRMAV